MNNQDKSKVRSFCAAKEKISKVKRQPAEWERIFAHCTTDRGLIFRIYKVLQKLNKSQTNNSVKWAKKMNRHSSRE